MLKFIVASSSSSSLLFSQSFLEWKNLCMGNKKYPQKFVKIFESERERYMWLCMWIRKSAPLIAGHPSNWDAHVWRKKLFFSYATSIILFFIWSYISIIRTFLGVLLLLLVHLSQQKEGQDGADYEQRQQNQKHCNTGDTEKLQKSTLKLSSILCLIFLLQQSTSLYYFVYTLRKHTKTSRPTAAKSKVSQSQLRFTVGKIYHEREA